MVEEHRGEKSEHGEWQAPKPDEGKEEGERKEELSLVSYSESAVSLEREGGPNQDAFIRNDELQLYGVLDGMGGYEGGREASQIAKAVIEWQLAALPNFVKFDDLDKLIVEPMREVLQEAHDAIVDRQAMSIDEAEAAAKQGKMIKSLKNMGTTATIVKFVMTEAGPWMAIAHIGDSRAYIVPEKQEVEQMTVDHSNAQIDEEGKYRYRGLEVSEEKYLSRRNRITSVLGGGGKNWSSLITPYVRAEPVDPGDKIVLTSDGVTDNMSEPEETIALIRAAQDPAEALVNHAKGFAVGGSMRDEQGNLVLKEVNGRKEIAMREDPGWAKHDDMTAVVVEVG